MRPLAVLLTIAWCAVLVLADTEIINFHRPLTPARLGIKQADLISDSFVPSDPVVFNLSSSEASRRFILDFGEVRYAKWTVRASWPGSYPARIAIEPPTASSHLVIRGSALSPRMYHPLLTRLPPSLRRILPKPIPLRSTTFTTDQAFSTPIHLLLEPLILGVIPQTAMPAIGAILAVVLLAALAIPSVFRTLHSLVNAVDDDKIDKRQ
ncbi:hypothetical protein IAU60_004998 [Kwoniella sp. DSM 27419]